MAVGVEKRTVDKTTYRIQKFTGTKALETFHTLSKYGLVAIAKAGTGLDPKADAKNQNIGSIFDGIAQIFTQMGVSEFTEFAKSLLETTSIENEPGKTAPLNFDEHFSGNIMHMFKVIGAVIEVNYTDFFDAGKSLFGKVKGPLRDQLTQSGLFGG